MRFTPGNGTFWSPLWAMAILLGDMLTNGGGSCWGFRPDSLGWVMTGVKCWGDSTLTAGVLSKPEIAASATSSESVAVEANPEFPK